MSYIAQLKGRVLKVQAENEQLRSLVEAFWTGSAPDVASFEHVIMAQWGRKRLEEKKRNGVLLTPQ